MRLKKGPPDPEKIAKLMATVRRDQATREDGYRERAMKLFPHICGRCGREFSGLSLRELTVHHKDGDHMNNPPDGSNWELLCEHCHAVEHGTIDVRAHGEGLAIGPSNQPPLGFNAFEGLKGVAPEEAENSDE